MMTEPWVRIVIVTYNSGNFTQACVNALASQTDSDFEAIIVDNLSTDEAIESLILPDARFTIKRSNLNTGFARGSNLGLQDGTTTFVMTLNPDTTLEKTCLAELRTAADNFPNSAMFSPILYSTNGQDILDGAGDSLSIFGLGWRNGAGRRCGEYEADIQNPVEVFGPTGAAALYRRYEFEREGGFDSDFFCYLEDVDLALRLRARGQICLLIPTATGVHIGGHSSDAIPGFALEQSVCNGLGMIIKSAPVFLLPIMLVCHLVAHSRFQFRNRGTAQAAIRIIGFRRGLRNLARSLRARLRRRPYPIGASFRIGQALSWSIEEVKARPLRILNRQ